MQKKINFTFESRMFKKTAMAHISLIFQTLLSPFIYDRQTAILLRQVSRAFRYFCYSNCAKDVAIGLFTIENYEAICGKLNPRSVVHVNYRSVDNLGYSYYRNRYEARKINITNFQKAFPCHSFQMVENDVRRRSCSPYQSSLKTNVFKFECKTDFDVKKSEHVLLTRAYSSQSENDTLFITLDQSADRSFDAVGIHERIHHKFVEVLCIDDWQSADRSIMLHNHNQKQWELCIKYEGCLSFPFATIFCIATNANVLTLVNFAHKYYIGCANNLHAPEMKILNIKFEPSDCPHSFNWEWILEIILLHVDNLEQLNVIGNVYTFPDPPENVNCLIASGKICLHQYSKWSFKA